MKIYTRTGDAGLTSLVGGKRVAKDSPRLEAYGTLDELNSFLGHLLCCSDIPQRERQTITLIQNKLFNLGAYLANDNVSPDDTPQGVGPQEIANLEEQIDILTSALEPQRCFILPAGCESACRAHICRSVCRRAERRILSLHHALPDHAISPIPLRYLNRLSDYLFTLARFLNHIANHPETPWQP